jgi:hypothetical protein
MVPPRAQITGINEKPRAIFVSSVSSANILLITPMFPLSMPFKHRLEWNLIKMSKVTKPLRSETKKQYLKTSAQKERESPKRMIEMIVPRRPNRRTGLRPM